MLRTVLIVLTIPTLSVSSDRGCFHYGYLNVAEEWHGRSGEYLAEFFYEQGSVVDFNYNISYDYIDSTTVPITLVLLQQEDTRVRYQLLPKLLDKLLPVLEICCCLTSSTL